MQTYAEEAVERHMPRLQAEFFHQNTPNRNPTAPFLELEREEIKDLYESRYETIGTLESDEKRREER